jgi:hypothetical protein
MRGMKASTKHKGCVTTTSFDYVFGSQNIHSFNYEIAKSKTRGVSQCGIAIYIIKSILRQKRNYGNSNIFTMQKCNLQKKIPLQETKILQDIITL